MAEVVEPDHSGDGPPTVEKSDAPVSDSEFTGPFFQAIGQRKRTGRDAKVLVTAKDAQTGVGKTNLCDFLAYVCDTTEEGFAPHKTTIEPAQFFSAYSTLEPGSSLVLEEGEQLDPRRAMQKENVEASHTWQMARVREIIAFINLPSPKFIDNRMEELADYWVNVLRRGRARIYRKRIHDTKGYVFYETMQDIEWPNMDGSATFREMANLKDDHLDGNSGSGSWVPPDEHQKTVEKATKEARKEKRDALLSSVYKETDVAATELARCSAIDITDGRIRQIANQYDE